MEKKEKKAFEIDAEGMSMGRLASIVAGIVLGKDSASYLKHQPELREIKIKNIDKVKFTGRKYQQKIYRHHTGYLGHLKEVKMKILFERNPSLVFKKVLRGMLPKNTWRDRALKKLSFI